MKNINFILIFLIFLLIPGAAVSDEKPSVLLLNSDRSVERYGIVQEEFKKTLKYPIKEVYINDRGRDFRKAENIFKGNAYDLIFCIGTKAYMTAYGHTGNTPVVFSSILNWQRLPERTGTYGVSNEPHAALQIMVFRYIFPDIRKVGVLYSNKYNRQWFKQAKSESKKFGIQLIGHHVSDAGHKKKEYMELLPDIDALWLISDPTIISSKKNLKNLLKLCDRHKVPVFSYNSVFIKYGAMLIVSADDATIGRQAAGIAQDLLQGMKDIPNVQFPAGSQVILNLKKVKTYNLTYKEDALGFINRIIE